MSLTLAPGRQVIMWSKHLSQTSLSIFLMISSPNIRSLSPRGPLGYPQYERILVHHPWKGSHLMDHIPPQTGTLWLQDSHSPQQQMSCQHRSVTVLVSPKPLSLPQFLQVSNSSLKRMNLLPQSSCRKHTPMISPQWIDNHTCGTLCKTLDNPHSPNDFLPL